MTIKKRIIISNMIVLALLLSLVVLLSFYITNTFVTNYENNEPYKGEFSDDRGISSYELQRIFNEVIDVTKATNGKLITSPSFKQVQNFLKSSESLLMVTVNGECLYITEGYTYDTLYIEAIQWNSISLCEDPNVMYTDSSGYIFKTNVLLIGNQTAQILMVNTHVGTPNPRADNLSYLQSMTDDFKHTIQTVCFIGIAIIIIVNIILAIALSKSIMKPLKVLKEGTKKISEGNLDFEVEYTGNDEIQEVLHHFDNMKIRLAESVKQQQKYEDNRKELIAGISHDLRTPLTAIKGYVSGLMDGIADSPEKKEKYLNTILHTATEMDKLVDELFMFSKLDMDKIPFKFDKVEIGEFLELCCEELKFGLEKNKISLSYSNRCPKDTFAMIDRDKFGRVLLNISNNSVKYKKDDVGSFHVDVCVNDANNIEITLKDNGNGIPVPLCSKIFESFYRTDPARTNPVQGSGLGLSICKQIVENHKGSISAESGLGEGLSIIIILPKAEDSGLSENKQIRSIDDEKNTDS